MGADHRRGEHRPADPADVTTTEHDATADNRLRHRIQAATPDPGRTMPARTQEQGSTRRRVSALLLASSAFRRVADRLIGTTVGPKDPLLFAERSLVGNLKPPARRQNRGQPTRPQPFAQGWACDTT